MANPPPLPQTVEDLVKNFTAAFYAIAKKVKPASPTMRKVFNQMNHVAKKAERAAKGQALADRRRRLAAVVALTEKEFGAGAAAAVGKVLERYLRGAPLRQK